MLMITKENYRQQKDSPAFLTTKPTLSPGSAICLLRMSDRLIRTCPPRCSHVLKTRWEDFKKKDPVTNGMCLSMDMTSIRTALRKLRDPGRWSALACHPKQESLKR